MNPRVTVLMPAYNAEATIDDAIRSILGQSVQEFEFLVVDDGSTDNTVARVRAYTDSRIRVVPCQHRGLTETLNEGLRRARGEWIARMDADDIALANRLERQLQAAMQHRADVVCSWYAVFISSRVRYLMPVKETHEELLERMRLHNDIVHSGVLIRREILLRVGGYHEEVFEDYDLWLRMRSCAHFYAVPEVLTLVRYSPLSHSRRLGSASYAHVGELLHRYSSTLDQDKPEDHFLLGWRNYFYGSPIQARHHWRRLGMSEFRRPRLIAAFLLSYFPENIRTLLKEARLRQRMNYLFSYWSDPARASRCALRDALRHTERRD